MRRIITAVIGIVCAAFILIVFNNYRINRYVSDDIGKILSDKKYEKPIELKGFPVFRQLYSYSCGPATMSMVCSYLVKPETEKELSKELNLESRKKGMLPNTFLKYIRMSMKDYDIELRNNIPDSEVLKIIYSQLEKGIPIPVYFSTINDWDKPNYDTHYSIITGIDMGSNKLVVANAYGFREEVNINDFLESLKYENYKNKPAYLTISNFLGIINKNNIYIISRRQ